MSERMTEQERVGVVKRVMEHVRDLQLSFSALQMGLPMGM
jgi:hypothetical protein